MSKLKAKLDQVDRDLESLLENKEDVTEFEMKSTCNCGESLEFVEAKGDSGRNSFCIRMKKDGLIRNSCYLNRKTLIRNLQQMDATLKRNQS